ncbi:MAG: beta-hydroxyacyl-ACP dehydratase [Planctomycetota bacterium]|nr:beta-hydroxyacyl-ACP dehydratase [Planctomycetota bacterium]MDA1163220.1 beta-hydroxyacyl-ACP dehydratase [Planctomycetota bacterium]
MRFSLIDRIVELDKGQSITTVKNLSLAEEYLQDHFPGFAVMPGVMMVEALVQSGAWLMRATEDFKYSTVLLKQAKAVKFNSFVTPGKQLLVTVTTHKWGESECTFKAQGTVDGESAVSARITLSQLNLKDRNESQAKIDEYLTGKMKELFAQVWQPAVV